MSRSPNTNRRGSQFSEEVKLAVWKKGRPIMGFAPTSYRKDVCGAGLSGLRVVIRAMDVVGRSITSFPYQKPEQTSSAIFNRCTGKTIVSKAIPGPIGRVALVRKQKVLWQAPGASRGVCILSSHNLGWA